MMSFNNLTFLNLRFAPLKSPDVIQTIAAP